MKNLLIFLLVTTITIVLDNLYFEYCVSRELPMPLIITATIVVIIVNALVLVTAVKSLIKILNL